MVHLPDVRFHPRTVRFHRTHHPFHLHSGVRRTPSAVRLVHRDPRHLSQPPVRVCPPEPDLYAYEQAQTAGTGAERPGERLGRSADAHPLRCAPPRLYARSPENVLREDRREQTRPADGHPAAGMVRAPGPQRAQQPVHGGAGSRQGDPDQLSGRPGGVVRLPPESGRSGRSFPQGAFHPGNVHRTGRLHGRRPAQVLPPETRRRGAAEIHLYHPLR